ncbi:MAG: hypothetical protein M3R60_14380, partial [Pseudomonadota bacterium]|nr:hypothetical protein [Pseudomonadota bacterium]
TSAICSVSSSGLEADLRGTGGLFLGMGNGGWICQSIMVANRGHGWLQLTQIAIMCASINIKY